MVRKTKGSLFKKSVLPLSVLMLVMMCSGSVNAAEVVKEKTLQDALDGVTQNAFTVNNLWLMIAAAMVFIMHLGFAMIESGLTRAKNSVNVLFKNTMIPCIGLLTYCVIGFGLMYPGEFSFGGLFGFKAFGLPVPDGGLTSVNGDYTYFTDFLFQGMFAATAATIVSGAVAERVKLGPFLIFSVVFVAIAYPITGSWVWGGDGSWLSAWGFHDLAGSTAVHAVGGAAALVCAVLLGPRLGKYRNGRVNAIPGHNMPMATMGCFLLWFGWFGFNGGSILNADPAGVSLVLVTTCLAAAAGGLTTGMVSWVFGGKPDLSMALNGVLAGLVGITAGADIVSPEGSIMIGMIAGVLVYFSVIGFDKIKVDDPVGAISVHLVCGIWGTIACAIFNVTDAEITLTGQLVGAFSVVAFSMVAAGIVFGALKYTVGIRVSAAEEVEGLDLGEHDMAAYPDFSQTYIKSYHAREI